MSEVRLVVRELERDWSGKIHGSCADRAIAALSADPVTLEDLELAVSRFANPQPDWRYLVNLSPGLCDEPYDAGLVVIDLVARLVVVDSTYSSPGKRGSVCYHNGRCATSVDLPYCLADDWLITSDGLNWQALAEQRRRERSAQPVRDVRQVFYGRPLLEFIAREVFAAFARREEIAAAAQAHREEEERERQARYPEAPRQRLPDGDAELDEDSAAIDDEELESGSGQPRYASLYYDAIRQIHANWMLAPRSDLGGACPREAALERRDHLMRDMQDRCLQWSRLNECPPGLDPSSHAYRYGGFGTHELVKYYDLVPELIWSCWEGLETQALSPDTSRRFESLTVGDFLADEIPRLEQLRETLLDEPDPEFHGHTARSIIERERARLPEAVSGHDAMVDPDCPCCQMMAETSGPMFWHLDGSGMDWDFAFDLYRRTREEWDEEQRRWAEYNRRFDAEWTERKQLGVTHQGPEEDGSPSIWMRSFASEDAGELPLGVRVFGIGCQIAELIVALRRGASREATPPEAQARIDQLNRDFANLREILRSDDVSASEALLDPALERCVETLAGIASDREELAEQCELIAEAFRNLFAPPPPTPDWGPEDLDIPF